MAPCHSISPPLVWLQELLEAAQDLAKVSVQVRQAPADVCNGICSTVEFRSAGNSCLTRVQPDGTNPGLWWTEGRLLSKFAPAHATVSGNCLPLLPAGVLHLPSAVGFRPE